MWFRKRESSVADGFDAVDPVESLRAAATDYGADLGQLRLLMPLSEGGPEERIDRNEVWASDGTGNVLWRVDGLRPLFRGDRPPPPDGEMAHYPVQYVPFFYGIENGVLLFCSAAGQPTDAECEDVYSQMRRRPDGKSTGPLHDAVWQAAALALGLRPWSEAEYTAVFGQLARSARHFKMGRTSRNYLHHVRETFGSRRTT